jgi:hypothetical protein
VGGQVRKGLDATEGNCVDARGAISRALAPIRALMDVYLLDLEGIWTEAFARHRTPVVAAVPQGADSGSARAQAR